MSKVSDIRLINLSNYVKPTPQENKSKGWVLNGKNNSFYQDVINANNGSPTNASINKSYIDLIYGRGLSIKNSRLNDDFIKVKQILRPKDVRRICSDFQIFGEASFQIIPKRNGDLSQIKHVPQNLLAPSIANEDNEIESYWFSENWSKITQNPPEEYKSFNTDNLRRESLYAIKPYQVGNKYFSDPEYLSALPYCTMEEEIANLNVNVIKKGLSAGYIINVPDGNSLQAEEKDAFERAVKQKLTSSSNGGDFIISFNGRDVEVTITPFPVNDNIHKQWEFLTEEAKQQILTAHRATSPSIVGIISSSGFSNTADEMDTAELQLVKRVIRPKQEAILDALEEVLVQYGINVELMFKPLTEAEEVQTVEMSKHVCCSKDGDGATIEMANALIEYGEDLSDEWELLLSNEVDYDTDDEVLTLINFATSTGVARPNASSEQDSEDIIIRYRYVGNPNPQRDFCKKMMRANKLYRKEDILQMERSGINDGFGLGGTNSYSIWLWKGGGKISANFPNGTCKHKWQREIYLRKNGSVDVNSPLAQTISTSEARRRGYKVPTNDSDVSIAPHNNK